MSVSRHREFTKGLGNRESGPEETSCILMGLWSLVHLPRLLRSSSVSHPPFPHLTKSSSLSHNETRIILILPHLVTKPLYLRRRADYNNLFAPSGASLTGLSNETSVLLLVKRNVFPRMSDGRRYRQKEFYTCIRAFICAFSTYTYIHSDIQKSKRFPLLEFNHIFILLNITNIHNWLIIGLGIIVRISQSGNPHFLFCRWNKSKRVSLKRANCYPLFAPWLSNYREINIYEVCRRTHADPD